jgi:hypothetical protein
MNKNILLSTIKAEFETIGSLFQKIEDNHFSVQPYAEKWSIAQHTQHLIDAVKGIAGAMKDTGTLAQFGKADRPSLDYVTIKINYQNVLEKLKGEGKMPYRHLDVRETKVELLANFKAIHQKLVTRLAGLTELELDTLQVPHPVLGMMTMREMLLFTAIHIKHHYDIVAKM